MVDEAPNLLSILSDVTGLGKPIEKFIDAVRDQFEPNLMRRRADAEAYRTRTVAKSESDAAMIQAEGKHQVSSLEQRMASRVHNREIRRQHNIEAITQKALDVLPETVSAEPVHKDWIYSFFGACEDVSDELLQSLWASLLAGEVARPEAFSLKTLDIVKLLRQSDAELFAKACKYAWVSDQTAVLPGFPALKGLLEELGLSQNDLLHLDSLGLLHEDTLVTPDRNVFDLKNDVVTVRYIGEYRLQYKKGVAVGQLQFSPFVAFTLAGDELYEVSNPVKDPTYQRRVVQLWRKNGLNVEDTA